MTKSKTAVMLNIEAQSQKTVAEAGKFVLAILATPNGDAVKIAAIQAITAQLSNHTTVSNCQFTSEA